MSWWPEKFDDDYDGDGAKADCDCAHCRTQGLVIQTADCIWYTRRES